MRSGSWMAAVLDAVGGVTGDVRYAIRMSRKNAGLTILAVLPLAVGIGANTAVFSLINALWLRPLPVRDAQRLVFLTDQTAPGIRSWNYAIWDEMRQYPHLFAGALAWSRDEFRAASSGETEVVDGLWVSGSFLETLGVRLLRGRPVTAADDQPGGGGEGPIVVISHRFWQRRFGSAESIGQTLTVDHIPFTIVGVTRPEFFGADVGLSFDVLVPFAAEPLLRGRHTGRTRPCCLGVSIMGRLKNGETIAEATARVRTVQSRIREATLPVKQNWRKADLDRYLSDPFSLVPATTGNSPLRLQYAWPLLTLMVAAVLVLLIACANVANLLLARGAGRTYEMHVRLALGASPRRLMRQLLTESAVIACASAALGLVIAHWSERILVRQVSTELTSLSLEVSLDWRVLTFVTLLTSVTALLFGIVPALRARRATGIGVLARDRTAAGARVGPVDALVIAQIGISLVLVVAAGLFLRTFWSLATRPLGFDHDRVLMVGISAERTAVTPQQRPLLFARTVEAAKALPNVADAALSFVTPISGVTFIRPVQTTSVEGQAERARMSAINLVSPGWFHTLGIRFLAGRDFTRDDRLESPPVVVVNEAFVRKFLEGRALGQTIGIGIVGPTAGSVEIVGVVADAVNRSLREDVPPTMYFPLAQLVTNPPPSLTLSVRSKVGPPALLTKAVSGSVAGVNSDLMLTFRPLTDRLNAALTRERITALLSTFFGLVALVLAALGLFGVTAYAVARRRTEIAIRLALGATAANVVGLILSRVVSLVGLGLVAGTVASLWVSRLAVALLYEIEPTDPAILVGGVALLAFVGIAAGWLAARPAALMEPAWTLKDIA